MGEDNNLLNRGGSSMTLQNMKAYSLLPLFSILKFVKCNLLTSKMDNWLDNCMIFNSTKRYENNN